MDNLHPQTELLLAYADQQLSDTDKVKVEKLLTNDPDAMEFLQKLEISNLPFAQSFEFLLEEKTPSAAIEIVKPKTKKTWFLPASVAASLMVGIAIGFLSFSYTNHNHDNWITQVADYHLLYSRDTVQNRELSDTELQTLKVKLSKAINTNLNIPNLSSEQLQFKRGQILEQNGKPLIQLVYLPSEGKPIALCLLRTDIADSSIEEGKSRGMSFYTWSKNGLSYVIVGDIDNQWLKAAAIDAASQLDG